MITTTSELYRQLLKSDFNLPVVPDARFGYNSVSKVPVDCNGFSVQYSSTKYMKDTTVFNFILLEMTVCLYVVCIKGFSL